MVRVPFFARVPPAAEPIRWAANAFELPLLDQSASHYRFRIIREVFGHPPVFGQGAGVLTAGRLPARSWFYTRSMVT